MYFNHECFPSPPLDNIRVLMIVWRLRGNIIRTATCWIVSHNVHSQQHTYMSSSYRSNRLGLSHWDPYAVCRDCCLELYYCNMVELFWWNSNLISTTNWFPSVLWHCWSGHQAWKNCPRDDLILCSLGCEASTLLLSTSAFSHSSPIRLEYLSFYVASLPTVSSFKTALKTHNFQLAHCT